MVAYGAPVYASTDGPDASVIYSQVNKPNQGSQLYADPAQEIKVAPPSSVYAHLEMMDDASPWERGQTQVRGAAAASSNYSDIDHVATMAAAGAGSGVNYSNLDDMQGEEGKIALR